jgi:DNA-binding beta-propeller fold protein YncE/mono/diheme cytochrome c family protein
MKRLGWLVVPVGVALVANLSCVALVSPVDSPREDAASPTATSISPATSASRAREAARRDGSYTLFEAGPVRPLALAPGGRTLVACNVPDGRLEVFGVSGSGLRHRGSVSVGLEPVAVAFRSDAEAWVVNHLSDSVSVVALEPERDGEDPRAVGRVVHTLLVGDEPRDVIVAGPGHDRVFVTTAHRGQNVPYDPQLTQPGVGRADVWVFDAEGLDDTIGGTPMTILNLFCDTPRALAASPDGTQVYAAGFHTGNKTTTVFEEIVTNNGGVPAPFVLSPNPSKPTNLVRVPVNFEGVLQPTTGLIVKYRDGKWQDEEGRDWSSQVKFDLPDKDVFVIDAAASPPVETRSFESVGTILFNMAVNPVTGNVYVANTDAQNDKRFEGNGVFAGHSVRGHIAESRITVLDGKAVTPRHLNKHIDYEGPFLPIPNAVNAKSLAFPTDMAVTSDGETLYVAAFGSSKVGVFSTRELEEDTFRPDVASQIVVSGGGPCGLALDEARKRLYVYTRFDDAVKIVDTTSRKEVGRVRLFSPEPERIVKGRRYLYDASFSSSRGDTACASCHVFGDTDSLAWDLGDPDGVATKNGGVFTLPPEPFNVTRDFRPMKGPMTTQSLRGMANHGAMHWRGDRQDTSKPSVQPDSGAFDEGAAFLIFNSAFQSLNGRNEPIPAEDMKAFRDFVLEIVYPPNPIRALDDQDTAVQRAGRELFTGTRKTDAAFNCVGCHVLDPAGNAEFGVSKPGFFGTDGRFSFESEPQVFKIPHLRNLYQKVGKFGMPETPFFVPFENGVKGEQIRGFGFLHDGSLDTLVRFHSSVVFLDRPAGTLGAPDKGNPEGFTADAKGFAERRAIEQFLLAFPSNQKPIVGQQVTLTATNERAVRERIDLMIARAEAGDCDLVVKGAGRGYVYEGRGVFRTDRAAERTIADADLRARAREPRHELTYTCVPLGSGTRIGIDRRDGGRLDGDEPGERDPLPRGAGEGRGGGRR